MGALNWRLAGSTRGAWGWRPSPILWPLIVRRVPFVVVGSVASAYYTLRDEAPADLDIVIEPSDRAADRAFAALSVVAASQHLNGTLNLSWSGLRDGVEVKIETRSVMLHVIPAKDLRPRLVANRRWVLFDCMLLPLCARADLAMLKRRHAREKDMDDLARLENPA